MNFRKDINGLRAFAVMSVVIFHFNPRWLTGGFIGVDIFFVISGFLMTSIIFRGIQNKQFSITKFYLARFKRIVPALTFVSLALLIFGFFFMLNMEYQTLGKHVKASLLFISNHTYWMEAGYFAADSHEKWLLHTWSLSVEWQFYIIYPLIVLAFYRMFGEIVCKRLMLAGAILGFVFCVVMSYLATDAAYFLLPTRAWQMLAGGLIFLYPIKQLSGNKIAENIGLIILVACCWFVTDSVPWPGYVSIIPILATVLIMQAGNQNSLILSNPFSQIIGKWSYSIYLWHWPIVVFISNFVDDVNLWVILLGVLASTLLGALSYQFIERPKRNIINSLFFVITLLFASFVQYKEGIVSPIRPISQSPNNEFISYYQQYDVNRRPVFNYSALCSVARFYNRNQYLSVADECVQKDRKGGIFLWGDSHMGALSIGIRNAVQAGTVVHQITSSGCPSSFVVKQGGVSKARKACDVANELALEAIKLVIPDIVIIANKDKHEKLDWEQTVKTLTDIGVKQVVLLGPLPQWFPSLPRVYAKGELDREYLTSNKLAKDVVETNTVMNRLTANYPQLTYIDVLNKLCVPEGVSMKCKVMIKGELIAWDYGHSTDNGSNYIASQFIIPRLNVRLDK